MDRYYIPQGKFYIGAICPNCDNSFNLLKGEFKNVGEDRILFCGKCKIDKEKIFTKIEAVSDRLVKMRDEEMVDEQQVI
jgi:hypothetical protein